MKTGTGKRLEIFIDSLNISKNKFAESIGKKAQNLNIYFNGSTEVGYKMMNLIKSIYPQLNIDWLKTGKGEPLINSMVSEFTVNSNKEGGSVIDKEKEYLKKENEALKLKVEMLEEALARRSWELITKSGRISNAAKKNNRNNNDK